MDQHDLLVAIKNLAIDLGRTPTRAEFEASVRGGKYQLEKNFGTFAALIHAAGLDPEDRKRPRLTNEIFKRDISEVLESYEPREIVKPPHYTPTVVIGDTHFPFVDQRVLDSIYEFIGKYKPGRVIQIGDLFDMYAHSKFPKSMNIYTPNQEEDLGVAGAKTMWQTIRSLVPKADCVQLKGNHDVRPVKRTLETNPASERATEFYLNHIMSFEGVNTIQDSRQEYIVEGIMFHHGYKSKLGDHMGHNLMNFACGHSHKGGVIYRRIRGQTIWELNAGLCGDPESKVQSYTAQKNHDCTVGFGFIDEYGPRFIPL